MDCIRNIAKKTAQMSEKLMELTRFYFFIFHLFLKTIAVQRKTGSFRSIVCAFLQKKCALNFR
jgi:hypothetical protein